MCIRITKKQVFENEGIEYITKGQHIIYKGYKIPKLLVKGNRKIGKGVYHFSMLAGFEIYNAIVLGKETSILGTCSSTCPGCYGMSGNYLYKDTINALALRTWLARTDLEFVEKAINAQIKADKIKYIRIHATGDFFSLEYLEMWKRIIANNPNVIFWTYTKETQYETEFDKFDNANIVHSIIPGKGFNFGKCDYILSVYEFLSTIGESVYICKCGIDKEQHCTNCKGCSCHKYVLFIEHGTGYNAEKDKLYPILKNIIEQQENETIEG